jgi:hypothetical protein
MLKILVTEKTNKQNKNFDLVITNYNNLNELIETIVKFVYKGRAKFPNKDNRVLSYVKNNCIIFLSFKNQIELIRVYNFLNLYKFNIYLVFNRKIVKI